MGHDVFLSYSSADKATALAVLAGLEDQGIRCWIAPRDIPAGSEYGQQIVEAVKTCTEGSKPRRAKPGSKILDTAKGGIELIA